jgi:hypothetical protein
MIRTQKVEVGGGDRDDQNLIQVFRIAGKINDGLGSQVHQSKEEKDVENTKDNAK